MPHTNSMNILTRIMLELCTKMDEGQLNAGTESVWVRKFLILNISLRILLSFTAITKLPSNLPNTLCDTGKSSTYTPCTISNENESKNETFSLNLLLPTRALRIEWPNQYDYLTIDSTLNQQPHCDRIKKSRRIRPEGACWSMLTKPVNLAIESESPPALTSSCIVQVESRSVKLESIIIIGHPN